MNFEQHIKHRCDSMFYELWSNEFVDHDNEIFTVKLTDFSGKLTGYQQYNWKGDKKNHNCDKTGKYFSYITKGCVGVFGLNYWSDVGPIFLVEGIFDAITMMQFGDAIAVLSNNPKHLRNQLSLLRRPIIAVCDGGAAGKHLAKYADYVIYMDDGEDANSVGFYGMFNKMLTVQRTRV